MSDTEAQEDDEFNEDLSPSPDTNKRKPVDLSTKIWEDGKLERVSQ